MEKQYERKSSIKILKSKNKTACITIINLVFVGGKKCITHFSVLLAGTSVEHSSIGKDAKIPQQDN